MAWISVAVGLCLCAVDYFPGLTASLRGNVIKRLLSIAFGVPMLLYLAPTYLGIGAWSVAIGLLTGLGCLAAQVVVGRGIRLRRSDFTSSMAMTMALIYLLELPAEEFLYRGLLLLGCLKLWGPWPAVIVSSGLFLGMHVRTWRNPYVWAGSAVLSVICSLAVIFTGSLWTAVFVHDLNDFGFLTLVGRRDVFSLGSGSAGN